MPRSAKWNSIRLGGGALLAGLVLGAAAPAFAQPTTTVEEITVIGRYGPGGELRTLSQTVSYADLDLTTDGGRNVLQQRIKDTAHSLCLRLGEQPHQVTPPVMTSCEQSAISSAEDGMRTAVAMAKPKSAPGAAPTAVAEAAPPPPPPAAESATAAAAPASVTVQTLTNGPVPDTPENRSKYGGPMSNAGKRTAAKGN